MKQRFGSRCTSALILCTMLLASCRIPGYSGSGTLVYDLARDIDALERQLELYGSIVVKQPDIWGQARLTKHRDEYEQEMAKELGTFAFVLNGAVAGSDQAYLADAFALSSAASTSSAPLAARRTSSSSSSNTTVVQPAAATTDSTSTGSNSSSTGTKPGNTPAPASSPAPMALPDQSSTFAAFNNISRNGVNAQGQLTFAGAGSGISLEPPLLLDQKSQYLNHLHELRRINEGDDTADSPGYSLNLVRIPVSLLPGKKTDVGYGAEVTMIMRPYLNDELLPTTFRNLVINDLIDQLAFPITKFINDHENAVYFDQLAANDLMDLFDLFDRLFGYQEAATLPNVGGADIDAIFFSELRKYRFRPSLQSILSRPEWAWIDELLMLWDTETSRITQPQNPVQIESRNETYRQKMGGYLRGVGLLIGGTQFAAQSKSRRSQLPFPPHQLISVYGWKSFFQLARDINAALSKHPFSRTAVDHDQVFIHLPDVQGILREKLLATYELLRQNENQLMWDACSTYPQLSTAIRNDDQKTIALRRIDVSNSMKSVARNTTTQPITWAILVEACLLNEKLKQDMRESAGLKGQSIAMPAESEFFRPDPSPEARAAFCQYVQCRWPIHVFALDPAAQNQNLQSTFSTRREMQLALSLAFVSGNLSAQNMLNYARRLEFDYATIDLNGTAIGFSHGEESFGWRFYPRFQTPDIENNFKVAFRDLLCGGPNKNAILKQRRLEPGVRECYAVVIMPSFVPYATLSVSTSWFDLTNPRTKQLNSTDAMELSQRVKCVQGNSQCLVDGACYRDADVMHLTEKVRQIESRLPFQTTQVQVPYENTLGGFAMFNTGVTELSPELVGFYGTSAINPNYGATLFLVGNHFSVHSTTVIAGGQPITKQQLLSREVIQVTIPPHPMLVADSGGQYVDVQLATPYGITQHLLIPAVVPADANAGFPPPPPAVTTTNGQSGANANATNSAGAGNTNGNTGSASSKTSGGSKDTSGSDTTGGAAPGGSNTNSGSKTSKGTGTKTSSGNATGSSPKGGGTGGATPKSGDTTGKGSGASTGTPTNDNTGS